MGALRAAGAVVCGTAAEAGARPDIVILLLTGAPQVKAVRS